MFQIFKIFILYFSLLIFTNCVGVIEEAAKLDTSTVVTLNKINFDGIKKVVVLSHNKVQVYFQNASGGSGKYNYFVYKDGNTSVPVGSLNGETATADLDGNYSVVVSGLSKGIKYSFMVRAQDSTNEVKENNTVTISVTTLSYEVPIFDGIYALENLAGVDGKTKLKAVWFAAEAGRSGSSYAIGGYNIYVSDSYAKLATSTPVPTPYAYASSSATEYTLQNLTSGSNYFVRVRAKDSNVPAREELNLNYLEKKTLTDQPIAFAGIETLSIAQGEDGYSTINLSWGVGSGTFDRYRIYLSESAVAAFNPSGDGSYISGFDITDLSTVSATRNGLNANTTYYVAVVACNNSSCTSSQGQDVVKSVTTSPNIAQFGGITGYMSASDATSDTLILNWDLPDFTSGVCSSIRVYRTDILGTVLSEVCAPNFVSDPPCPIPCDATSVSISGLTTETNYYFVAKTADKNGNMNLDDQLPTTTMIHLEPPDFKGKFACTNQGSNAFTIVWTPAPTPGVYSAYEIYSRKYDIADTSSVFSTSNLNQIVMKDTNSASLSSLIPNNAYEIGIKTYFQRGTTEYRSLNTTSYMCNTSESKVNHRGWLDAFAIGPKINGLTGSPITEVIPVAFPEGTSADSNFVAQPIPYEYDSRFTEVKVLGVSASNKGIIRLAWEDFTITGDNQYLYEYSRLYSNTGYRVYRKGFNPSTDNVLIPGLTDFGTPWSSPVSGDTIVQPKWYRDKLSNKVYYADFVDYSVEQVVPTNSSDARIYWYKVEAVIDNKAISFYTPSSDAVIKVILPPKNMALVHRWIANKEMCTLMGKEADIDRSNHYRCPYNGIGNNDLYYDIGGHLIVDRFTLGCNFTRGNPSDAAEPTPSAGCWEATPNTNWEGSTTDDAKGIRKGDCIGHTIMTGSRDSASIPVTTPIYARRNAVYYSRGVNMSWTEPYVGHGRCLINRPTPTSAANGSNWYFPIGRNKNFIEDFDVRYDSSKLSSSSISSEGEDIAAIMTSNNAYLPPINGLAAFQFKMCKGHKVTLNSKNYYKRTLRRKEQIAAFAWHPMISSTAVASIELGSYTVGGKNKSCNISSTLYPKTSPQGALDFTNFRYPTSPTPSTSTKPIYASGSRGDDSTEWCTSRYGLQDHTGNMWTVLADTVMCDGGHPADESGALETACTMKSDVKTNQYQMEQDGAEEDRMKQYKFENESGGYQYFNFFSGTDSIYNGIGIPDGLTSAALVNFNWFTPSANRTNIAVPIGLPINCDNTGCSDDDKKFAPIGGTMGTPFSVGNSNANFLIQDGTFYYGSTTNPAIHRINVMSSTYGFAYFRYDIAAPFWPRGFFSIVAGGSVNSTKNGRYQFSVVPALNISYDISHTYEAIYAGGRCAVLLKESATPNGPIYDPTP
ncbi:MAG: hypothetical protein HQK49_03680 [Oligoflexia bacterium]|nr:hypothetical protein [Oligoflexia bacterium]